MAAGAAVGAPPKPLGALYDFIKTHLVVANNVALASATLVASLDFLAPRVSVLPRVAYSATAGLLLLMVLAAIAPGVVGRLLSALGYAASRADLIPMWRRPAWQCAVVVLLGVSILGFASAAKAGGRGWIASEFPAVAALQDSMLGLRADLGDIKEGVAAANGKLDGIAAASSDPQRDLVSRGYSYDDSGLSRAIRQGDARVVALFAHAGYKAMRQGPMVAVVSGDGPWPTEAVAALTRPMFDKPGSCEVAEQLMWALRAPAADRLDAFKRLCDPAPTIARLRAQTRVDDAIAPANAARALDQAARRENLALLSGERR